MSAAQADNPFYRTGEVVVLLGIPEHVLRYWEKALPLLMPHRSFGRRHYNAADIALLCRVRHLVRGQGLKLEAALERLLAERSGGQAEYAARLQEARADLIDAYFALRRLGSPVLPAVSAGQNPVSSRTATALPPEKAAQSGSGSKPDPLQLEFDLD